MNNIELLDKELACIKQLSKYINSYEYVIQENEKEIKNPDDFHYIQEWLQGYLNKFNEFVQYCERTNKLEHLEEARNIQAELIEFEQAFKKHEPSTNKQQR
jgi:hypothetical protein